jgi:DNA (cytosine-5)-methyltransferase 1
MMNKKVIPVIDIFAGPGGLGEGFFSYAITDDKVAFQTALSIEKDPFARETLKLRTFFREFIQNGQRVPEEYYAYLRQSITLEKLYEKHPVQAAEADKKAWLAELGSPLYPVEVVRKRINESLGDNQDFVLIGGPPCQAYSLAGRSRNKGNKEYVPKEDKRQTLYIEYLQILADHHPAIFVMENVKGLLSAKLEDEWMFQRIMEDLSHPAVALERKCKKAACGSVKYKLFSLVEEGEHSKQTPRNFVIKSENYGIPQTRHRVVILGVREDVAQVTPNTLQEELQIPIDDVIKDLPRLRSGISAGNDSSDAWKNALEEFHEKRWFQRGAQRAAGIEVVRKLEVKVKNIHVPHSGRGAPFIDRYSDAPQYRSDWFVDPLLNGVCNHETRAHIVGDLHRYFYSACFALRKRRSPTLKDFPKDLLPDHRNVQELFDNGQSMAKAKELLKSGNFSDRFRVQIWGSPATTITSHIAKDGHYFIHPDPTQCRSLTVREAARIQTFPDNYFFCGPRTSQYHQVGNAVPPLLAVQIAKIVYDIIKQADLIDTITLPQ